MTKITRIGQKKLKDSLINGTTITTYYEGSRHGYHKEWIDMRFMITKDEQEELDCGYYFYDEEKISKIFNKIFERFLESFGNKRLYSVKKIREYLYNK